MDWNHRRSAVMIKNESHVKTNMQPDNEIIVDFSHKHQLMSINLLNALSLECIPSINYEQTLLSVFKPSRDEHVTRLRPRVFTFCPQAIKRETAPTSLRSNQTLNEVIAQLH